MNHKSAAALDDRLTVEQIAATSARVASQPAYIRLPKTGTLCPFTGLSRSKMNELVLACPANNFKPPVKSVCLRQKGAIKGIRLVVFKSLMDYLHSQEGAVTR